MYRISIVIVGCRMGSGDRRRVPVCFQMGGVPFEWVLWGVIIELVEHVFERDREENKAGGRRFARGVYDVAGQEIGARNLEFCAVEDGVVLPFECFVKEVRFKKE